VIPPTAPDQDILSSAAAQYITARAADETIVTRAADETVPTRTADQEIVLSSPADRVRAPEAADHVSPGSAVEMIRSCRPDDRAAAALASIGNRGSTPQSGEQGHRNQPRRLFATSPRHAEIVPLRIPMPE
jgi:hypothetical protein